MVDRTERPLMPSDPNASRAGVIIAGGFSKRFGDADKAVATLGGTPLIRRVADRLTTVTDDLVVNCRREQVPAIRTALESAAFDPTFAVDPTPDLGPVAGILTGLEATDAPVTAVVACDMPFVDPAVLGLLFDRLDGHGGPDRLEAVVPRLEDGWYQTTQAVYRTDAMATACRAALEADETKLLAPLDRLEWMVVDEETIREHGSLESFESIDTRADLDAAVRRL